jgi:hypothetical protein
MTTSMLPPSQETICEWCGGSIPSSATVSVVCPLCSMPLAKLQTTTSSPTPSAKTRSSRKPANLSIPENNPIVIQPGSIVAAGVDPGARYTGISVIDNNNNVLLSTTLVRPLDVDINTWARFVVDEVDKIISGFPYAVLGVEGTSDPKGFKGGKRAAINPKDIIKTGIIVGGLILTYRDAVIIKPGGNGSAPIEFYPDVLKNRRPTELPGSNNGAGTRNHERSAYDVARKALEHYVEKQSLAK